MTASSTNKRTRIRLLVADIDGTLVTKEKLLTARSVDAVSRLQKGGVLFGITTGRPPRGTRMLVDSLPGLKFIAGFNGGIVVRRDFSLFKQNLLEGTAAEQVAKIILEHKLDVWVYTERDWFVRDPRAYRVDKEQKTVQFPPKVTSGFDGGLDHVAKIVGVSQDHDAVARCEKDVQERLGSRVSAARSQPFYLDVTHPKANKGEVVRMASEFGGFPTQQIATIGDMANDITMFEVSGVSIAMGNASPEVQKAATYVTSSNAEEGFAAAVDKFILPQEDVSAA